MKLMIPTTFKRLEGGELGVEVLDCPFGDACRRSIEEGVKAIRGETCAALSLVWSAAEIVTGERCDYVIEELSPPVCKGRVYKL